MADALFPQDWNSFCTPEDANIIYQTHNQKSNVSQTWTNYFFSDLDISTVQKLLYSEGNVKLPNKYGHSKTKWFDLSVSMITRQREKLGVMVEGIKFREKPLVIEVINTFFKVIIYFILY